MAQYNTQPVKANLPRLQSSTPRLSTNMLQQGSQGDDVTTLQNALTNTGDYAGKVDGDYGPVTSDAVMNYQRRNSQDKGTADINTRYDERPGYDDPYLPVTGDATPATMSSIFNTELPPLPTLSQSQYSGNPAFDFINQMAEMQAQNQLGNLQSGYQQSMLGLQGQSERLPAQFNQASASQSAGNMQAQQRLRERMAQMGLGAGQALSQESRLSTANQQALTGIGQERRSAESDLQRQGQALNIGYQNDLASSINDIESRRMQQMYSLYQQHPDWFNPSGATASSGGGSSSSSNSNERGSLWRGGAVPTNPNTESGYNNVEDEQIDRVDSGEISAEQALAEINDRRQDMGLPPLTV